MLKTQFTSSKTSELILQFLKLLKIKSLLGEKKTLEINSL